MRLELGMLERERVTISYTAPAAAGCAVRN
jgi:hypothetical protein